MDKIFSKNDNEFECVCCGKQIEPLKYSSRDHCTKCLCSLHVDVNPGDRANTCKGLLVPISVEQSNKKGYVINYKCTKCGKLHNNKAADDDSFKTILSVMNYTYSVDKFKQIK